MNFKDWFSEKTDHYFDWMLYPEEYEEFIEDAENPELENDEEDE